MMQSKLYIFGLVIVCAVSIGFLMLVDNRHVTYIEHEYAPMMRQAAVLAGRWYDMVGEYKRAQGITGDNGSNIKYGFMLGDDYTAMTTTLGSLEAKETAANPDFAALIVRLLTEAGIDSFSTVGVTLSGSFPSLGMAALAALQTIGTEAIIFSSLGSSTFGANQEGATWIDMENYLIEKGSLKYHSALVTIGAENDNGGGLSEDGVDAIKRAAERCGVDLYIPESLDESIHRKTSILKNSKIAMLINIGGNQASLGSCAHAVSIPNGYHAEIPPCGDPDRGIMARLSEEGVPSIHLLNIRDLAMQYGIPISSGMTESTSVNLYSIRVVTPYFVLLYIAVIFSMLIALRKFSPLRSDGQEDTIVSPLISDENNKFSGKSINMTTIK